MKFLNLQLDNIEKKYLISFSVTAFLSSIFFFSIFKARIFFYLYLSLFFFILGICSYIILLVIYKKNKETAKILLKFYFCSCSFFNIVSVFIFNIYLGFIFLSLFIIIYILTILKLNFKYFVLKNLEEVESNVEIEKVLINSENYFDIKINNLNSKLLPKLKNKFESILKLKVARSLFVFIINATILLCLTSVLVLFSENKVEFISAGITIALLAILIAKLKGDNHAR